VTRWNVIVLGFEGDESLAAEVSNSLAAAWLTPRVPTFSVATASTALTCDNQQHIDAVVLVIDQRVNESRILRLLSHFEELGVPVMAMLDSKPEPNNPYALAGAVVFDLAQPPAVLAAILQGMLHRQAELLQLRGELALGQRFQGGMRGEMAKMHDELQLAATVQRELLPRELRAVRGVEFAALWRPVNYVSGDIYDIITLDPDHVGIFLADAVGHGVPAALMTMVLCQSLKPLENGRAGSRIRTPAEVMRILNEAMIRRQGGNTRFASAVYAVLDCRNRVMTLSGAGHPPPLKFSPNGAMVELCTSGGLLGVFPDEEFKQVEFDLELGDRLLLFSDGFEQAFPGPAEANDDRRLPTTRYRAEFEKLLRAPDVTSMIDAISGELDQQRGSLHQIDDLTLICVHAGPLALDTEALPDDLSAPLLQPRASVA
jgi:serine phosphatase RsbU (regulator of sigma subunit)